jgi:hypothetical protein
MCILGVIFAITFCTTTSAQSAPTQTEKEWVETVKVELPQGLEVFSGISRYGNPKYWIEIEGIKVFLSATNKEHYINNTCTILLVEWYNKYTNTYKYTTRQKKESKMNKINIEKL